MDWFRLLLLPLTLVYGTLIALRRALYRSGVFSSGSVRTPSISMGGLHVGGLGKTPLAFHVLERLQSRGLKPAFLSQRLWSNDNWYPSSSAGGGIGRASLWR